MKTTHPAGRRPPRRRGDPRPRRRHRPRRRPRPLGHPDRHHHARHPGHLLRVLRRPGQQQLVPEERPADLQGLPVRRLVHRRPQRRRRPPRPRRQHLVHRHGRPHRCSYSDSHNVISMGVSKVDGRLHLNMDSHSDGFIYVKSVAGLMDNPAGLELDREPLRRRPVHPRRARAHLAVHLPAVRLHPRRQAPAQLPGRHLRQRPQRPRRVRRHVLDRPRRVVQLHRHVHQRARLQHGPQHVPARHRLRRRTAGCTPSSPGASRTAP